MFIDMFATFFSNIFNIIIGIIFALFGIIIGMVLYRVATRPKNQIIYCRERDGRAMELNIKKEDHISLETDTKPPLRFYKFGRSYEFRRWGRPFTRFFGKEGTAYTWILQGFHKLKPKPGRPSKKNKGNPENLKKKIDLAFPNLASLLKSLWGEPFFASVPDMQRQQLEENRVLVTVDLEPGMTPEGYEPITDSTIRKKAKEDAAELIGKSLKGAVKTPIVQTLIYLGCGAGIGWILNFLLTGV